MWTILGYIALIAGLLGVSASTFVRPVGAWLGRRFRRGRAWWVARRERQRAAARRAGYADCLRRETAGGRVIPVRHDGYSPTKVTYSDGSTTLHFADWEAYETAMNAQTVPLMTTFASPPPKCPC